MMPDLWCRLDAILYESSNLCLLNVEIRQNTFLCFLIFLSVVDRFVVVVDMYQVGTVLYHAFCS